MFVDLILLLCVLGLFCLEVYEVIMIDKEKQVLVRYIDNSLPPLEKHGDWVDLYAREDIEIKTGEHKLIPLNVAMKLPNGFEAYVLPRSSTYKNYGLLVTNSMGMIDNDYCGNHDEWKLSVVGTREAKIEKGARIAQFRIQRNQEITLNEVFSLSGKDRGGFGSSGK